MKIFAAGLSTETNTFSAIPTTLSDFAVQYGQQAADGEALHPSLDLTKTWGAMAKARGYEFVFALNAAAEPAGTTVREAYETLRDAILERLRAAGPVDVVLLMLHGAMVAQGYDDCEEDLIRRVRQIVGPGTVIGVELDLHCHLSQAKIECADIVITYKQYPHSDVNERAREVFDLAIRTQLGEIRPVSALFDCRMIGLYPTTRSPMREFVEQLKRGEDRDGILSVSFAHGFQFGDVAHMGSKMLVISDGDAELAARTAEHFGSRAYNLRTAIPVHAISRPIDEALRTALASEARPVVVADQSDNTGAGAPGDSTFALRWLIDHKVDDAALAILYDPVAVELAKKAGTGASVQLRLGGKLGPSSGDPVDLEVVVGAQIEDYLHGLEQGDGDPWLFRAGDIVALRAGGIDIVVSSERCQCFSPVIFTDLGINPAQKRLLIPKSFQHFHNAFAAISPEIIYMTAPGAVAPDPRLIPYAKADTSRLYPWCENPFDKSSIV